MKLLNEKDRHQPFFSYRVYGYPSIELRPGGGDESVTVHNVEEFVERTVDWALYRFYFLFCFHFHIHIHTHRETLVQWDRVLSTVGNFVYIQGSEKSVGSIEVWLQHRLPHGQAWSFHA